jgi:hypothetical protein
MSRRTHCDGSSERVSYKSNVGCIFWYDSFNQRRLICQCLGPGGCPAGRTSISKEIDRLYVVGGRKKLDKLPPLASA